MAEWSANIVVLEGIERYVRRLAEQCENADAARKQWKIDLQKWIDWEREHQERRLILIGTDMMKGIVPANSFDRMWRDAVGWCFQDTAESADLVCQIWYGLPQIIKNEEEEK
nr:bifunctional adenosylcobinamide kinase/adenosylcobinamide-phosphate guanylyltransferase [Bacillus ectoiniformans]